MQEQSNPLLCKPESGICEIPAHNMNMADNTPVKANKKPVKIIYYTDPICSSCWGIEPQLRKLKLAYGPYIEVEYRMGGLLPDWSYNSGGISKPSDVAHHWDEVSLYYDMPIDGDVWLEDPLHSSYPPSIACKAAQLQDNEKAILFLRHIREMVFLQKKNITKWEHLESAAKDAGLDLGKFKADYDGKAKELFQEDLALGRSLVTCNPIFCQHLFKVPSDYFQKDSFLGQFLGHIFIKPSLRIFIFPSAQKKLKFYCYPSCSL